MSLWGIVFFIILFFIKNRIIRRIVFLHNFIKCYLCFLRNIIVVIAVVMTEITFESIEGNLKPSGACRIYPNAIKVQTIAGSSAMI